MFVNVNVMNWRQIITHHLCSFPISSSDFTYLFADLI